MQKSLTTTLLPVACIGEEIGLALGEQMVKTFQEKHPGDVFAYEIGRNIISEILAQPGCVGIKFFNAYNEVGEKTLVYVGLDNEGKVITEIILIGENGEMIKKSGIVADRIRLPKPAEGITGDEDWGWTID